MKVKFFDGFSWAVPLAFSEAVSTCMFVEGDALYDTKKAYTVGWEKAPLHIRHYVTVRSTAASPKQPEEGSRSVFAKNWTSGVTLELHSSDEGWTKQFVETTQGRLYSLLWHGDVGVLSDDSPNPPLPATLRELSKRLDEAAPFAKEIAGDKPVFVMARDLCNSISTNKHLKVAATLHKHFQADNHAHSPKEVGLEGWQDISPTIDMVFFVMGKGEHDEIHDALKDQLYTPAPDAKTDNFRLSAHGLLIADY